jgi:hypothetical protein
MRYLYRELISAVSPRIGLAQVLEQWREISRDLCEPRRQRKRQLLS